MVGLSKRALRQTATEGDAPAPVLLDLENIRRLAEAASEGHRLAFARAFAFTALKTCWQVRGMQYALRPPEGAKLHISSPNATVAAEQFGAAVALREPEAIAYLIGAAYTAALPPLFRASHGIFYTPPELVERLLEMAEEAGVDWATARVLDPAAGGGAFLIPTAIRMAKSLNGARVDFVVRHLAARLKGFEIDAFGAWLTRTMLQVALCPIQSVAATGLSEIVEIRDSLDIRPEDGDRYDLVIGNPPYGRVRLPPERRTRFARCLYGHANLYALFTDAALHWTRDSGVIAFVTPTSMLSGLYFKSLRRLLVTEAPPIAVNFVEEREGVFADVLQETMLATYRRHGVPTGTTVGFIVAGSNKVRKLRRVESFPLPRQSETPWLLPRSVNQAVLTRRLWAMPHRLADYGYSVSTGPLVWNRHKPQLQFEKTSGARPVIWAESVTRRGTFAWRTDRRNHAPWFAPRGVADGWLIVDQACILLQRTTAKEQHRRLIAAELPDSFIRKHKGVTVENHLNMIRAAGTKPKVPARTIASLFNSGAVDTAFRCINGSVAVSAYELEHLALPSPAIMNRLTALLRANAPARKIEQLLAGAYRLTDVAAAP